MPALTAAREVERLGLPAGSPLVPAEHAGRRIMAKFFRAIGDPTRLLLLEFLLGQERTVSECIEHVGLSQSRVSHTLRAWPTAALSPPAATAGSPATRSPTPRRTADQRGPRPDGRQRRRAGRVLPHRLLT